MKKKWLFLICLLLFPLPNWADTIIDQKHQEWQGEILEKESNARWVVLQLARGGKMRFLRKEVTIKSSSTLSPFSTFVKKIPKKSAPKKSTPSFIESSPSSTPKKATTKKNKATPTLQAGKKNELLKTQKNSLILTGNQPSQTNRKATPTHNLPPMKQPSFLNYLMGKPWYIKILLGAVLVLSFFVITWKVLFRK